MKGYEFDSIVYEKAAVELADVVVQVRAGERTGELAVLYKFAPLAEWLRMARHDGWQEYRRDDGTWADIAASITET